MASALSARRTSSSVTLRVWPSAARSTPARRRSPPDRRASPGSRRCRKRSPGRQGRRSCGRTPHRSRGRREQLAVDDDARSASDLAEDADGSWALPTRSEPPLGKRCEIRLVLDADAKRPDPARSSSATATSDQPRFGARSNVPVAASVRPGTATTRPATTRLRSAAPRAPPRPALRGGRARDRAQSASCPDRSHARSARCREILRGHGG